MNKLLNRISMERVKFLWALKKDKVKKFLEVVDEVEEIYIKLEYEIITKEELEETQGGYFDNEYERYTKLKQLIENLFEMLLESDVSGIPFVEKVFRFKKEYVFSIR